MTPKRVGDLMNQGMKFRESISMGFTSLTEEGVREIICAMEKQYIGQSYDMLHKYVLHVYWVQRRGCCMNRTRHPPPPPHPPQSPWSRIKLPVMITILY